MSVDRAAANALLQQSGKKYRIFLFFGTTSYVQSHTY